MLLLTGGLAAQHSRVLPSSDLLQWLFVATLAMFFLRRCRCVALLLLGYLVFVHAGLRAIDGRLDSRFEGDSMLAQVRIVDFPKSTGASVTLLVEPVSDHRLPRRSRVNWFEPPRMPQLGDVWELELRLRRPRGNSNPGGFRLEDWAFRERIQASGYVVPGKRNQQLTSGSDNAHARLRQAFVQFVEANAGDSAAVIAAIGIGTRHRLSSVQWDQFAHTGTSHLMAISGLHIGLAAAAAFVSLAWLLGCLRVPGNQLHLALVGAALIAAGYALVSGFAVPSQRATLMLGLAALAMVLRRRRCSARIVALVAIGVFVADPLSLLQPGFLLSFTAVIVLLLCSSVYQSRSAGEGRMTRAMAAARQLAGMQIVLLFGLLPLTTMLFGRIAIIAPLANFILVPIFSLVSVPLTLVALSTFGWFPSLARLALRVADVSIAGVEKMIALFATIPSSSPTIATSGIHWLVVFLPALWVLLPRSWPGRWLAPIALLALLVYRPATPRPSCFDLHVLDVGQALAVVVQTDTRTLLFDTGAAYRGGSSAAAQVVIPFLRHRGINTIDWLMVSHADNDHAGGVAALLAEIQPGRTYVGETLEQLEAGLCATGQQWHADGVTFQIHHPDADKRRDGNNASCVLSITAGRHRALLTGDIEAAAERDVLRRADLRQSDVVVIPHHGSLTSSSGPFVARLQPQLAIASAAHGNRWGLPREEVVKRWQEQGASVLDTAGSGAISVLVCADGGARQPRENRKAGLRFWQDAISN